MSTIVDVTLTWIDGANLSIVHCREHTVEGQRRVVHQAERMSEPLDDISGEGLQRLGFRQIEWQECHTVGIPLDQIAQGRWTRATRRDDAVPVGNESLHDCEAQSAGGARHHHPALVALLTHPVPAGRSALPAWFSSMWSTNLIDRRNCMCRKSLPAEIGNLLAPGEVGRERQHPGRCAPRPPCR